VSCTAVPIVRNSLPPLYEELRLLNAAYDADQFVRSQTKQRIVTTALGLFPGYDLGTNRFFSRTGRALIDAYRLDPSAIVRAGRERFQRTMRQRIPGVHTKTLNKIAYQADTAVQRERAAASILTTRIQDLMGDLSRYEARMARTRTEIETLGLLLQEQGHLCQLEHLCGLTLFNLARIAGEVGPFSDFHSKRVLLRYAGLNLRERSSGTYKGLTRISKKGRITLRKVLAQATFPLLKHDRLYGSYYAQKRKYGMAPQKAKAAVMRKFLIMVYAMSQSREPFSAHRFTHPAHTKAGYRQLQMVC
jgi:transposase